MRAHLLATTAAVALLAAMPARAQDATWQPPPGNNAFNAAGNWSGGVVPGSVTNTGTASFGPANTGSNLAISQTTTLSGFTFNADAPAYSFNIAGPFNTLLFGGPGIINNSPNRPTFDLTGGANMEFVNASAGNAIINITGAGGTPTEFRGTGTAANATITLNNSSLNFLDSSKAGNATIINNATNPSTSIATFFHGNSSADHATTQTPARLPLRATRPLRSTAAAF